MKSVMKSAALCLLATMVVIAGQATAMAGTTVVYNNGLPDGNDAWTIDFGYTVADSFTLSGPANVDHVDVWVVMFPGDTLNKVEWTIFTLGPTFNRVWGSGTAAATYEGGDCSTTGCKQGFSFPGIALPAGTYYLKLSNAQASNGDPVYWCESGGSSLAFENAVGTIPSEAFDVVDPPAGPSAPQPSSSGPGTVMLGTGALGLAGMLARKLISL
ncbi:MAG TPA: hypothetical protein VKB58_10010 [Terriglobales bacterium]|nr:hypothetical protein [Terriglobales bacterium]